MAPNIQGRWELGAERAQKRAAGARWYNAGSPRVDGPLAEPQGAALVCLFLRHRQRQEPCFMFPCRKVIKCPGAAGIRSPINSKGKAIFCALEACEG